jgi:hypothetical protein
VYSAHGTIDRSTSIDDVVMTSVTDTITVPGMTVAPSSYTADTTNTGDIDPKFTRKDAVTIPMTSMGMSFKVHVQGKDADGLLSEPLDFSVLLN